jgi:hypothetical protein
MLNLTEDVMWCTFAIVMVAIYSVPWYIALAPVIANITIFLIGVGIVRNYNKEIPRTSEPVMELYNNVQEIDDLLYTLSQQDPKEIQ